MSGDKRRELAVGLLLAFALSLTVAGQDHLAEGQQAFDAAQKLYKARDFQKAAEALLAMARTYRGHPRADQAIYMAAHAGYQKRDAELAARAAAYHSQTYPNSSLCQSSVWYAAIAYLNYARKPEKALPLFEEVALRMPGGSNRDSAHNYMVNCYMALKQYDKALDTCDQWLAKYADNKATAVTIRIRVLDILKAMKAYGDMAPAVEAVEKLAPGSIYAADANYKLASVRYQFEKDYQAAHTSYLKAADVPHYSYSQGCLRMAGICLELVKPADNKGAVGIYERYLNTYPTAPNRPEIMTRIAQCYVRLKDYRNEVRIRSEIGEQFPKSPQNAQNLWDLVQAHLRNKKPEEAMSAADKVVATFPRSPLAERAMYWQAQQKSKAGDNEAARTLCKQIVDQFPFGSYRAQAEQLAAQIP